MVNAYIFDLDGVIVDTARYHYLAWKRLADELSIPFTELDNERLKGVSRIQSLNILLSLGGMVLDENQKGVLSEKKNDWFLEYIYQMAPDDIAPGAKELITSLKNDGKKVALASSSKNARTVIKQLGIQDLFDVVVDGNMITYTKPHPEIFLLAAKLIHASPPECIVIEDAQAGVEAALRAGMKCIGIGSKDQLYRAHQVVPTIAHLNNHLPETV